MQDILYCLSVLLLYTYGALDHLLSIFMIPTGCFAWITDDYFDDVKLQADRSSPSHHTPSILPLRDQHLKRQCQIRCQRIAKGPKEE